MPKVSRPMIKFIDVITVLGNILIMFVYSSLKYCAMLFFSALEVVAFFK